MTLTPQYPLYVTSAKNQITRDQPLEFSISVKLDCISITYIDRIWSILFCEKLNPDCESDKYLKNLTATLSSQNTSDLYIPPFKLKKIGYYLIQCEVIVHPYGVQSLASTFVQIIPYEKIYFIDQQLIHIAIRQDQMLQLEPVKYSLETQEIFKV